MSWLQQSTAYTEMNKLTLTSDLVSYEYDYSIQYSVTTDARFSGLACHVSGIDNRAYRYILQHFWESGRSKSETRAGPLAVVTTQFITVC